MRSLTLAIVSCDGKHLVSEGISCDNSRGPHRPKTTWRKLNSEKCSRSSRSNMFEDWATIINNIRLLTTAWMSAHIDWKTSRDLLLPVLSQLCEPSQQFIFVFSFFYSSSASKMRNEATLQSVLIKKMSYDFVSTDLCVAMVTDNKPCTVWTCSHTIFYLSYTSC